ncbi:MAG: histidine phosphatase family protein [Burkholderiales bacterium]
MKIYFIHHAEALTAEENPRRPINTKGREQATRLGTRLRALGVSPTRILHSDKLWTIETAQCIAAQLGIAERAKQAAYPINTEDPIAPFIAEIATTQGDLMMCGHVEFLIRAASHLVSGDETTRVVEFKPGNGTMVCIEGAGSTWAITAMWRHEHAPG